MAIHISSVYQWTTRRAQALQERRVQGNYNPGSYFVFIFYFTQNPIFFFESGLCFCQGIPSNKIPLTYTQKKENKLLTHWSHDKVMLLMSIGLGLNVDAPSKDS